MKSLSVCSRPSLPSRGPCVCWGAGGWWGSGVCRSLLTERQEQTSSVTHQHTAEPRSGDEARFLVTVTSPQCCVKTVQVTTCSCQLTPGLWQFIRCSWPEYRRVLWFVFWGKETELRGCFFECIWLRNVCVTLVIQCPVCAVGWRHNLWNAFFNWTSCTHY